MVGLQILMIEIRHDRMDTTDATRDAYDQIYSQVGIVRHESYFLLLLSLLKPQPGKRLVDISCGQGQLVDLAKEMGLNAIGFDFSFEGVRIGYKTNSEAAWFVSDGERSGLMDACADYVTHIGSLEHYQNIDLGVQEIARLLKVGGMACILVPNLFSLFGNIQYSIKHGDVFDDGQPLQRYSTRSGWIRLLANNGLHVIKTVKYDSLFPRTRKDLLWLIRRPRKMLRLIVSQFVPVNLANSFIFLCERKSAP